MQVDATGSHACFSWHKGGFTLAWWPDMDSQLELSQAASLCLSSAAMLATVGAVVLFLVALTWSSLGSDALISNVHAVCSYLWRLPPQSAHG